MHSVSQLATGIRMIHWQRAVGESDSLIMVARAKIIEKQLLPVAVVENRRRRK
jgi:hypothetical protein